MELWLLSALFSDLKSKVLLGIQTQALITSTISTGSVVSLKASGLAKFLKS